MQKIDINELNWQILNSDLEGLYHQPPSTIPLNSLPKISPTKNICGLEARNYVRKNFIYYTFDPKREMDKSYICEFMLGENIPEKEKNLVSNYLDDNLKQEIFEKYIKTELKYKNFKIDPEDISGQLFYNPKINGVPLKYYFKDKNNNEIRSRELSLEYNKCLEILRGNTTGINIEEVICLKILVDNNKYFQSQWKTNKIKELTQSLNSKEWENYINKLCTNNDKLIKEEIVSFQKFNHEYHANELLKHSIFETIPQEFSLLEKTIYIYSKLCKSLTYDPIYYIDNKNKNHLDVSNIGNYNLSNNTIVCYEFSYILSDLLKDLGINMIKENIPNNNLFSNSHANISYFVENLIIFADSTRSVNEGDLSQLKFTNSLNGIRCQLYSKSCQTEFKQAKEKVINFLNEQDKKIEEMLPKIESLKINTLNEGIIILNNYLLNCNLVNLDFISYANKLISLLCLNVETKIISNNGEKLFLNILLDRYDEYGNKTKISYLIDCENKRIYNNINDNFIFQENLTHKHH